MTYPRESTPNRNISRGEATTDKGYPHPGSVIYLPEKGGEIHFQHGLPQEVGRNGCSATDVIQGLIDRISVYQHASHPMWSAEAGLALIKLEEAKMWINASKIDRA